jgi:hypothetical protein
MARADSAGARVSATFIDATGPHSQVNGASATPRATTLVSSSRLIPPGWNSQVECRTSCPWIRAKAGQRKNHRKRAASPQPQVATSVGREDHTCHHRPTPRTR